MPIPISRSGWSSASTSTLLSAGASGGSSIGRLQGLRRQQILRPQLVNEAATVVSSAGHLGSRHVNMGGAEKSEVAIFIQGATNESDCSMPFGN